MSNNVQHDPFARWSYLRTTHTHGECAWCGQKAPQDRKRLYTYTCEPDDKLSGIRPTSNGRLFCNLACFHAYHGD